MRRVRRGEAVLLGDEGVVGAARAHVELARRARQLEDALEPVGHEARERAEEREAAQHARVVGVPGQGRAWSGARVRGVPSEQSDADAGVLRRSPIPSPNRTEP